MAALKSPIWQTLAESILEAVGRRPTNGGWGNTPAEKATTVITSRPAQQGANERPEADKDRRGKEATPARQVLLGQRGMLEPLVRRVQEGRLDLKGQPGCLEPKARLACR